MIDRRTALKGLGAMAGVLAAPRFLTGCTDDGLPDGLTTIVTLCMENRLPVVVFDMLEEGNLERVIRRETLGTKIRS